MAFWSTTSGVVTGVAGTLTGVVGLATLAGQMGWIGGDDAEPRAETAGEAAAEDRGNRLAEDGDSARGDAGEADPEFAVTPGAVRFEALGARTATVTVRNTGEAAVEVEDVTVDAGDADRFTVAAAPCTATTLDPGRSCEMEVAFEPGGSGSARATMVVEVAGAPAQEVPLTAAALL